MTVYNVGSNGNAPSGVKVGDTVNTAGGLFQVVHPGTPGSRYNPESGYSSINVDGATNDALLAYSQANSERNTAKSQEFAREQMEFQATQNAKAMEFSAGQSQLNRDFQERMSSTAHQREVSDLIAAGLNPILSSKYGGSSTPSGSSASGVSSSGAKGDVDSTSNQMIGALLSAIISQSTALQTTSMNNMTSLQTAQVQAGATLGASNINAQTNFGINSMNNQFKAWMAENYPGTNVNGLFNVIDGLQAQFTGNNAKDGNNIFQAIEKMKGIVSDWFNSSGKSWDELVKQEIEYRKK